MSDRITHNQELVLRTLSEHRAQQGEAIAIEEIGVELNRRHNRTMSYDTLHGVLKRLEKRKLVGRDGHRRPARFAITDAGEAAVPGRDVTGGVVG